MYDTGIVDNNGRKIYVQLCAGCNMETACASSPSRYHEFLMRMRVVGHYRYMDYTCRWCRATARYITGPVPS